MGLEKNNSEDGIIVYPNPAEEIVNVRVGVSGKIEFYNLLGAIVETQQLAIGTNEVDLKGLPSGIYFFVFSTGSDAVTGKIIKQ